MIYTKRKVIKQAQKRRTRKGEEKMYEKNSKGVEMGLESS